MSPVFSSKKFWVSIAGALAGLILAILDACKVGLSPEIKTGILNLVMAIVGTFNVGQGIADGLSRGRTSGYARAAGTVRKLPV
jgi:hypothetical protein